MKGLTIRVIHLWPKPQHTETSCNELGGNCSGFRRTLSNLLPALLGTCYQHYQITNSIFQLDLLDKEEFTLRILEPRGFEPLIRPGYIHECIQMRFCYRSEKSNYL
jgi:hypothetical protein